MVAPTLVGPNIATQQGRAFCQFTIEAGQDDPTLQEQLVQLIADARDVLDATKFLSGTGTNEPSGILNIGGTNGLTTTQRVLTATTAAFAVGDPWLLKAVLYADLHDPQPVQRLSCVSPFISRQRKDRPSDLPRLRCPMRCAASIPFAIVRTDSTSRFRALRDAADFRSEPQPV